jgi:transcriptional antiterminator Rof (Rho-off)
MLYFSDPVNCEFKNKIELMEIWRKTLRLYMKDGVISK